jgi:acyl-CoA dehydrogenase
MKVLDRGRLNISAVSCGLASRIMDEARTYARDRKAVWQSQLASSS